MFSRPSLSLFIAFAPLKQVRTLILQFYSTSNPKSDSWSGRVRAKLGKITYSKNPEVGLVRRSEIRTMVSDLNPATPARRRSCRRTDMRGATCKSGHAVDMRGAVVCEVL